MNFNGKTAQEIQDEFFRQMPAGKRLELTYIFSKFVLELDKSVQNDREKFKELSHYFSDQLKKIDQNYQEIQRNYIAPHFPPQAMGRD